MTKSIQANYAMFSDKGNAAVHGIVTLAAARCLSRAQVSKFLEVLATNKNSEEATDTAVIEAVNLALGF
jgi:hypothetical protein